MDLKFPIEAKDNIFDFLNRIPETIKETRALLPTLTDSQLVLAALSLLLQAQARGSVVAEEVVEEINQRLSSPLKTPRP